MGSLPWEDSSTWETSPVWSQPSAGCSHSETACCSMGPPLFPSPTSTGPQVLPDAWSRNPGRHCLLRMHPFTLWWGPAWAAGEYLLHYGPPMGCRGIRTPAHGVPPPPLSPLTLASAGLFLSDILIPLSSCCCLAVFPPFLNVIPEALGAMPCSNPGNSWNRLCWTWWKLLAVCHWSHPCTPITAKVLQSKLNAITPNYSNYYLLNTRYSSTLLD